MQKEGKPWKILSRDGRPADKITDLIKPEGIVSLVGGGGKTSSMRAIGEELALAGNRVIMTTTTRMFPFSGELPEGLTLVGEPAENGKVKSVSQPDLLKKTCDYLLIEADGSKGLPVKAPNPYEPVITEGSEMVIAVLGLSGIGKRIEEACQRPERVCGILNKTPQEILTTEDAATLLLSPQGLRKNVGERAYAVILNQADGAEEEGLAREIAGLLPQEIPCVITAYRQGA